MSTNPFLKNVYVINLDRSADRLANVTNNLKQYNINFQRIPAVDGKKLTAQEVHDNTTLMCRTILCSMSVIGCALSHKRVWEKIAQSNDKWHMVCEDDITFTQTTITFLDDLSKCANGLPDELFINLSAFDTVYNSLVNPKQELNEIEASCKGLIRRIQNSGSTACYLITPKMARKLLRLLPKVKYHIDIVAGRYAYPNMYASYKRVVEIDYDPTLSTNMDNVPTMPILNYVMKVAGGFEIHRMFLQSSILTLFTKFNISGYLIVILALILLNSIKFKSVILTMYVLLEIILYIMLKLTS